MYESALRDEGEGPTPSPPPPSVSGTKTRVEHDPWSRRIEDSGEQKISGQRQEIFMGPSGKDA